MVSNYYGRFNGEPGAEFRSTFPVRYLIIDYGISCHFPISSDRATHVVQPFKTLIMHQAPESRGRVPHDPFASDIYMSACALYDWIKVRKSARLVSWTFSITDALSYSPTSLIFRTSYHFSKTCRHTIHQIGYPC
jgi:hypothetical protein